MKKSKLYIRTLSTILSVLTIFPGIYNSYGVKAGNPEDEVSQNAENIDKNNNGLSGYKEESTKTGLPLQSNALKEENENEQNSSSSTSSSKNAEKLDPYISPDTIEQINAICKQNDEQNRDELLKLLPLIVSVFKYCDITKYKWDEDDKEAISQGATQTLTEEQKSEICEMFTYVRSHEKLFNPLSLSGSFVASASFNFGSSSVTAYDQLREICTRVGTPIPTDGSTRFINTGLTWLGLSKDTVYSEKELYDVRNLFLFYRIPRTETDSKESSNICIRHALSTLILEIRSTLNLAARLGYMPVNDLTVQLLHAWQAMLDLMTGTVSDYVKNTAQPYLESQGKALKATAYEVADNLEKKMPNVKQVATSVQNIIQNAVPLSCISILSTYVAIKTISLGFKYVDKKHFNSPAEKSDHNEFKQPKQDAQKSQQLHNSHR